MCYRLNLYHQVFEETLTSDDSVSGITIKFSFVAQSREGANIVEDQSAEAVRNAARALGTLGSTPRVVNQLSSVVDTSTTILTEVQSFETTWDVLLKRMALFNKIVADIAAVFDVHLFDFFCLNTT